MSSYVPVALRRLVAERAEGLCEYCLVHEIDMFFGCQIEHIVAEKHGGATVLRTSPSRVFSVTGSREQISHRCLGRDVWFACSIPGPTGGATTLR
jgi:hypothetical protein